ncbi:MULTISPECIES: hypothetical protein [unclassified Nocardiopsis]|uniref:hypothetical protein n=1 Tax=unclassified Nocardiopsis TaxID=2649073 RepID=UPI00135994C7|nr:MULTISPECIES: hypothetical protein [unclassified Nocardiopsis]
MYNLLLQGNMKSSAIGEVIAESFSVPLSDVDISHEDEFDSRNWEARVFCDYSPRRGDVSWALDIYTNGDPDIQPTEEDLARAISRSLGSVVLFPPKEKFPSLWKVATPRGEVKYARIREPEEAEGAIKVTDVEIPVPELPGSRVSRFPEVIREVQIPTPIVDSYLPRGAEGELKKLRSLSVNWERLAARMASGWPPFSWYPERMYEEDLVLRDRLQQLAEVATTAEGSPALEMLDKLDSLYRQETVDDGGRALAEACGFPASELTQRPWYWKRRPTKLPW